MQSKKYNCIYILVYTYLYIHTCIYTLLQTSNKKLKCKIETMNYNKKPYERRVIIRTELCI